MTRNTHPHADMLISYAAGTLPNSISCVVACHLTLCPDCAEHVRRLETVGGLLLRQIEPSIADTMFMERAAAKWPGDLPSPSEPAPDPAPEVAESWLPQPLARYLGMSGDQIPWKRVVKGVRQYWVKLPPGSGQMRLLRLTPGKLLLEHEHTGMELTLVLQGVYGDHTGDYVRGEVIEWTEGTLHQPRASGEEECICLIASENTPYFSRLAARLLRPIMGF
ncbi:MULTISPECIES: ChrR family anti-sigma-E factor [Rhodomicrobium]|uniref:ChrR family anti-sigma-E factor n=1 Tax=Rhodomicrobium TaxID=1068 RepID=UPI000B4BD42D|nr:MULTISPECIES: ChrR family anti-sigma-E factor [Rhodomicrobium]